MLQWFIRFPEFTEFNESSAHLGKTPLFSEYIDCFNYEWDVLFKDKYLTRAHLNFCLD